MNQGSEALKDYITALLESYKELIKILDLEAVDIAESDEKKLTVHTQLESETVGRITSLTHAIHSYLEKISPDESSVEILAEISRLKRSAEEKNNKNISSLKTELDLIKSKIAAIKLPLSARRVYYSGNNPTLMDIEI